MKKAFCFLIALAILLVPASAKEPIINWLSEEYVGLDSANGILSGTNDQYSDARSFNSGMAVVSKKVGEGDNKKIVTVFIDPYGKEVFADKAINYAVSGFKNDIACVQIGSNRAYINPKGEVLKYGESSIGQWQSYFSSGLIPVNMGTEARYASLEGDVVFKDKLSYGGNFGDGLAPVIKKDNEKDTFSYITPAGEVAFETPFTYATSFSDGMAAVLDDMSKFGYIDTTGKVAIEPNYVKAGSFNNGYASVQREQESDWEMIDKQGKTLFSLRCGNMGMNNEGLVPVELEGSYGYADMKGNIVVEPGFDMVTPFNDGFALVTKDNRVGILSHQEVGESPDKVGDLIVPIGGVMLLLVTLFISIVSAKKRQGLNPENQEK